MREIYLITLNTLQETFRSKVFSIQLIFLLISVGLFQIFGHFQSSPTLEYRMIQDVGISVIALFGLLMTLFLGVSTLRDDLNRKTAYVTLTLPIGRWQYYLGKFFGTLIATLINILFMGLLFSILLYLKFHVIWHTFFLILLFLTMELAIVTSLVLLFSLSDSIVLSFSFTVFVYVMGNLAGYITHLVDETGNFILIWITKLAYLVIPNFAYFNVKAQVLKNYSLPSELFFWAFGYCVVYLVCSMFIGIVLIEQRDL